MSAAVQRHRADRAEVTATQIVVAVPGLLLALLRLAQLGAPGLGGEPAIRHPLDARLRIGELLRAVADQEHMGRILQHAPGKPHRMAHRHQARDRPGTAVPPVHDGGIELMPAFRGEYGTTPCVEVRRIFEHGHRRFHRVQGAATGRQDGVAHVERACEIGMDRGLDLGYQTALFDHPGASMDGQGKWPAGRGRAHGAGPVRHDGRPAYSRRHAAPVPPPTAYCERSASIGSSCEALRAG